MLADKLSQAIQGQMPALPGTHDAPTASIDPQHLTSPGTPLGTVAYMSPEQARGEKLDTRTDLFSFGAVLYEMATSRMAFGGTSVAVILTSILKGNPTPTRHLNPRLPSQLEHIISRALKKNRDLRYQNAAEIRTDLERLQRDLEAGPSPSRTLARRQISGSLSSECRTARRTDSWRSDP